MTVAVRSESRNPSLHLARQDAAVELSVVMRCLNEAETLETCILKAQETFKKANIAGEIIVADNGSTDDSGEIAEKLGAKLVRVQA